MDFISGIDKMKALGAEVIISNGAIEVIMNRRYAKQINLQRNVKCIKCGKELPYVTAMFHKKTDKPYCSECSGYSINSAGETVAKDESDIFNAESHMLELSKEQMESFRDEGLLSLSLTVREMQFLKLLLHSEMDGIITDIFEDKNLSKSDKMGMHMTVLEGTGILIKVTKTLGEEIPKNMEVLLNLVKPVEEERLMRHLKEEASKKKNAPHKDCICPECRKKNNMN